MKVEQINMETSASISNLIAERDDRRPPVVTRVLGSAWFVSGLMHVLIVLVAGLVTLTIAKVTTDDEIVFGHPIERLTYDAVYCMAGNPDQDKSVGSYSTDCDRGLSRPFCHVLYECEKPPDDGTEFLRAYANSGGSGDDDGSSGDSLSDGGYFIDTCSELTPLQIRQILQRHRIERDAARVKMWRDADERRIFEYLARGHETIQLNDTFDSLIHAGASNDPSDDCPFAINSVVGCGKPGAGLPALWRERF